MSLLIVNPTPRKGTALKLSKDLQEQVDRAFDAQAQQKYWENEFKASRDELVISLDNADMFADSPTVVTTRGSVNIQQRKNNEAEVDMIREAVVAGKITTEQLLRSVKSFDLDVIEALLGHEYVRINKPTTFVVLRPGAAVVEKKSKVAK